MKSLARLLLTAIALTLLGHTPTTASAAVGTLTVTVTSVQHVSGTLVLDQQCDGDLHGDPLVDADVDLYLISADGTTVAITAHAGRWDALAPVDGTSTIAFNTNVRYQQLRPTTNAVPITAAVMPSIGVCHGDAS